MAKKPDAGRMADMLQTHEIVSAFLNWVEEGEMIVLTNQAGPMTVADLDELALNFATDNKTERAALTKLLKELE